MKTGYRDIYARYRHNILSGVLKPVTKSLPCVCWPTNWRSREKQWKPHMPFWWAKVFW
jgi:hypothetical protein